MLPPALQHLQEGNSTNTHQQDSTLFSAPQSSWCRASTSNTPSRHRPASILGSHWPSRPHRAISSSCFPLLPLRISTVHVSSISPSATHSTLFPKHPLSSIQRRETTTALLKTEGWLLTSCSPSREDDPVLSIAVEYHS